MKSRGFSEREEIIHTTPLSIGSYTYCCCSVPPAPAAGACCCCFGRKWVFGGGSFATPSRINAARARPRQLQQSACCSDCAVCIDRNERPPAVACASAAPTSDALLAKRLLHVRCASSFSFAFALSAATAVGSIR